MLKFADTDDRFEELSTYLVWCNHEHNFLVRKDGRVVYLSRDAMICAKDILKMDYL